MTTFVLVHGGMHGAWCWEPLIEQLERDGHRGIAMDVPLDDPDATMPDYVRAVVDGATGAGDDAVLVGHSMAGLVVPHVALERPFRGIVFLCAMIAPRTPAEMDANTALVNPAFWQAVGTDEQGRAVCTAEAATAAFFHDVAPDLAAWATARLRPLAPNPVAAPTFLDKFPDLPTAAIVTTDDAMTADVDQACAHVRHRLGHDSLLLPGSHSPFLSRPAELAAILGECVDARL